MSLITRKGAAWGTRRSRNHSLEPETDPIPLPPHNYCRSGFISGRHQPWDIRENEQRNVQGKREEGGESTLKKRRLLLNEGLSGVRQISRFKQSG